MWSNDRLSGFVRIIDYLADDGDSAEDALAPADERLSPGSFRLILRVKTMLWKDGVEERGATRVEIATLAAAHPGTVFEKGGFLLFTADILCESCLQFDSPTNVISSRKGCRRKYNSTSSSPRLLPRHLTRQAPPSR